MEKEQLIIKNFGPIKDVNLDLRKTTIFIGEQASGKSTLAKLIGILRTSDFFNPKTTSPKLFLEVLHHFNQIDLPNHFEETTHIKYISNTLRLEIKNNHCIVLENTNFNLQYDPFNLFARLYPELFLEYKNLKSIKAKEEKMNDFLTLLLKDNTGKQLLDTVVNNTELTTYIPAERILVPIIAKSLFSLIDTRTNLPNSITRFGNLFETARNNYKTFPIPFLPYIYRYKEKDIIEFKNGSLELVQSSSGLQSIIPMLLVVQNQNSIPDVIKNQFIIEEPELNLYPTTQHDLMKYIISKCTKDNHQLTITTHSPYILSTLNVMLLAHKSGNINADEVNEVIPKESWINPEEFNAYFVKGDGTVEQIFNRKTGMIAENELDDVSMVISDEFDKLFDIYRSVPA